MYKRENMQVSTHFRYYYYICEYVSVATGGGVTHQFRVVVECLSFRFGLTSIYRRGIKFNGTRQKATLRLYWTVAFRVTVN